MTPTTNSPETAFEYLQPYCPDCAAPLPITIQAVRAHVPDVEPGTLASKVINRIVDVALPAVCGCGWRGKAKWARSQ